MTVEDRVPSWSSGLMSALYGCLAALVLGVGAATVVEAGVCPSGQQTLGELGKECQIFSFCHGFTIVVACGKDGVCGPYSTTGCCSILDQNGCVAGGECTCFIPPPGGGGGTGVEDHVDEAEN